MTNLFIDLYLDEDVSVLVAELVRARLGSTDAVRMAKEKLNTADSELAAVEKNMARTRSEFEGRDRKLAESIKTQQQAARDARTRQA